MSYSAIRDTHTPWGYCAPSREWTLSASRSSSQSKVSHRTSSASATSALSKRAASMRCHEASRRTPRFSLLATITTSRAGSTFTRGGTDGCGHDAGHTGSNEDRYADRRAQSEDVFSDTLGAHHRSRGGSRSRGGRCLLLREARRDAWLSGGKRLREVDHGPGGAPNLQAYVGRGLLRRCGCHQAQAERAATLPAQHANDLPGSICFSRPAHDGRWHYCRTTRNS